MKKLIILLLLGLSLKSFCQTPTVSSLSSDPFVIRYFNHAQTLAEHFDSSINVATASVVTDSAGHLQTHISQLCSLGEHLTTSDKMELASILFFADTTELIILVDSITVNFNGIISNYSGMSDQLADSLGATWQALYPLNLPQNNCLSDRAECDIAARGAGIRLEARCQFLNCSPDENACLLGCRVGALGSTIFWLHYCKNEYDLCMTGGGGTYP